MRTSIRSVTAAVVAVAASACTGSVSIDDLAKNLATGECQYAVKCGDFSDQAYCEAFFSQVAGQNAFNSEGATIAAVKAGKITYDGAAASKCIDALSSASCTQAPNLADLPGCSSIFTGTVADGATCITDEECKHGSSCAQAQSSTDMCAGTCTAQPGRCYSSADCSGGKVCEGDQCVTPVPAGASGQPCGTFDACQTGLYCDQAAGSGSSTCKPIAQANQPCDLSFLMNSCATGLMCIQTDVTKQTGTCLTPKTKGQSCQYLFECGGEVSPIVCDPSSKTCVDRPKTGACIQGVCDSLSAYCDVSQGASSATCKPFKAIGAACMSPQECGAGLSGQVDCVAANGSNMGTCTATGSQQACTP